MSKRNKSADRAARVAALKAEQQRKERQRRLYTIGGVVAALLLVVGVGFWLQSRAGKLEEGATAPAGATADYGLRIGESGADHEVVIFEDFLCPACKAFEDAFADTIDTAVADGRATVEYRPLDFLSRFGDYSQRTANAFAVVLDAAGPDVAKEFHDILYAEQPAEDGDHPDDAWLIAKAVEAGATESEVADGIANLEFEAWVGNGVKAATSAGIRGTPTVMVDGEAIDASTIADVLK